MMYKELMFNLLKKVTKSIDYKNISYFREKQMIASGIKSDIREIITVCSYCLSVDYYSHTYCTIVTSSLTYI